MEKFNFRIHQSFIYEQIEAVKKLYNIEYETFFIRGKGVRGYLKNIKVLKQKVFLYKPDLIHAHYGLSALLAILQFNIPVISTFHNGEILSLRTNLLASLVSIFTKFDIYVAEHIRRKLYFKKKSYYKIIPCGIDLKKMTVIEKSRGLIKNVINNSKVNIIFGGSFNNLRKNHKLAQKAISIISDYDINLIELKGYSREEVCELLNRCDLALLPSTSEGSPQFIKEAMACNCPIVATDVGDIKEIIEGTEGCFISSFEPVDVAGKIKKAIDFSTTHGRTKGRGKIKYLDNEIIAKRIYSIYKRVMNADM
ncbi:glycosyltransferase family 4 protein [Bacteroidota bacterium]